MDRDQERYLTLAQRLDRIAQSIERSVEILGRIEGLLANPPEKPLTALPKDRPVLVVKGNGARYDGFECGKCGLTYQTGIAHECGVDDEGNRQYTRCEKCGVFVPIGRKHDCADGPFNCFSCSTCGQKALYQSDGGRSLTRCLLCGKSYKWPDGVFDRSRP